MRPLDLGTNLSQVHEVGRLHRAADQLDEQGRRAQADDALRAAQRRREQVGRPPGSMEARVERDGRGRGGRHQGAGGEPGQESARDRPGEGDDGKGRRLDIRV